MFPLLLNGDCLEKMRLIDDKSVDLILVDLPYGTTKEPWDILIPFEKLWEQWNRIKKPTTPVILFGNEPFASFQRLSNLKAYKYDIYWEKERLTNIMQVKRRVGKTVETISVFYDKQPTYHPQMQKHNGPLVKNKPSENARITRLCDDTASHKVTAYNDTGYRYPTQVWKFNRTNVYERTHPTEKPVLLLEELIKTFSNEDDIVLDCCMGTGSCGVAAKNTNRRFIGIELDQNYFKIAQNRILK